MPKSADCREPRSFLICRFARLRTGIPPRLRSGQLPWRKIEAFAFVPDRTTNSSRLSLVSPMEWSNLILLKTCLSSYEDINVAKEIDGKPWISFLTWGRETGLNTLRDCKHVILVGVLRRSPLDLAASAAAANEDLSYRLCNDRQREVATSEMAHCVLQAMNRGSCRVMSESGKADPMKLTIIAHAPGVKEALADVLPGVSWTRREAEYQPRANTQTSEVANAIAEFLCRLPSEQDSISIRALKAAVGGSLQRDSWRVALGIGLSLASLSLGIGEAHWEKVGQSLKRMR